MGPKALLRNHDFLEHDSYTPPLPTSCRPDKLNSMNVPMWEEMAQCFHKADKDEDVRAIVLSGKGRMFTAGLYLLIRQGLTLGVQVCFPLPELDICSKCERMFSVC